nr:hypothetical protein [Methanobrevibacter arboriphilus]
MYFLRGCYSFTNVIADWFFVCDQIFPIHFTSPPLPYNLLTQYPQPYQQDNPST